MGLVRYIRNQFRHDRNVKQALDRERWLLEGIKHAIYLDSIQHRIDYLRGKVLNSTERGVSNERICDRELIVSLTSFGNRIYDVCLAIESIMQGTVKPNRIILWLSKEEFKKKALPKTLERQMRRGLQVEFCEDLRSYKKLIPALISFPDDYIITIDDDAVYEYDIVERLVNESHENPRSICACRMHKVKLDSDMRPMSYMDWDWCVEEYGNNSVLLFPTTGGGTLFPPSCFTEEVFNQSAFMELCPFADDIWFYAMRLMNNTPVTQVYTGKPEGYFIDLPSHGIEALSVENDSTMNCRNDLFLKAVFDRYNLYNKLQ